MEKRNLNIDALRVLMMIFIIMLHISGYCLETTFWQSKQNYISYLSFRSILFVGVSTFAFISGWFGVKWNTRKFFHYWLMAFFWGGVIFILLVIRDASINLSYVKMLLPLIGNSCWYLSSYLLLMIFSPILNCGLQKVSTRIYKIIIIILCVYFYIGGFIFHWNGTTSMTLLIIYLVGQFMKRMKIEPSRCQSLVIFLCGIILLVVSSFMLIYSNHYDLLNILWNNHDPLLLFIAIGLFFIAFNATKGNKFVSTIAKISPYMFAVYVIHVLAFDYHLISYDFLPIDNFYMKVIASSIIIMLICVVLEKQYFGKFLPKI